MYADRRNHVKMPFDPGTDVVGLLREVPAQSLVVLLTNHLGLQSGVAVRHQVAHFRPLSAEFLIYIEQCLNIVYLLALNLFLILVLFYCRILLEY